MGHPDATLRCGGSQVASGRYSARTIRHETEVVSKNTAGALVALRIYLYRSEVGPQRKKGKVVVVR